MFNGIIFNQGLITKFEKRSKGINIFVKADLKLTRKDLGVSVACDGVCLTLIDIKNQIMEFYLSNETIQRSKFKFLKINYILLFSGIRFFQKSLIRLLHIFFYLDVFLRLFGLILFNIFTFASFI